MFGHVPATLSPTQAGSGVLSHVTLSRTDGVEPVLFGFAACVNGFGLAFGFLRRLSWRDSPASAWRPALLCCFRWRSSASLSPIAFRGKLLPSLYRLRPLRLRVSFDLRRLVPLGLLGENLVMFWPNVDLSP